MELLAPVTQADGQIIYVPDENLFDSPYQYRRRYNEKKIAEMADSMRPPHGRVLQPILIRKRNTRPLLEGIDPIQDWEIIVGHQRRLATRMAGARLPCMPVDMTDDEVKRFQLIENIQREDVHPIEEAEGFQGLMNIKGGMTVEQLAAEVGKTVAYVYARLKLLQAVKRVRDACYDGEITAEVALLIARLRTPKLQEKALARIEAKYWDIKDGGHKSVRNIRELLREEFTLELKGAIFDPEDNALLPDAGQCSACPKRSGNAAEFADITSERQGTYGASHKFAGMPNLCTDPDCFAAKKKAHLAREASVLRASGKTVIDGNKARVAVSAVGEVKGGYIPLADLKGEFAKVKGELQRRGEVLPTVVHIQDPRGGKVYQAVLAADLKKVGIKAPEDSAGKANADRMQQEQRHARDKKVRQEKADATNALHLKQISLVRNALALRERTVLDLQLVVQAVISGVAYNDRAMLAALWDVKDTDKLREAVGSMGAKGLNMLLMDCILVKDTRAEPYSFNAKADNLLTLAKHHDIDLQTSATPPAPTPSPAAQAHTGAAKNGPVKYKNTATGETWSGKGLMPKWLRAATAEGRPLADFEAKPVPSTPSPAGAGASKGAAKAQPAGKSLRDLLGERADLAAKVGQLGLLDQATDQEPGSAGQEVTVDAGSAGKEVKVDAGAAGGSTAAAVASETTEEGAAS